MRNGHSQATAQHTRLLPLLKVACTSGCPISPSAPVIVLAHNQDASGANADRAGKLAQVTANRTLLAVSLVVIAVIAIWGMVVPEGIFSTATVVVDQYFRSRRWFVMLSVSGMLIVCLAVTFSRIGEIRLGTDDDRPKFSTPSWIAMLFATGMGVGLLFWATAEPLTHFAFANQYMNGGQAAQASLLATNSNGASTPGRSTAQRP